MNTLTNKVKNNKILSIILILSILCIISFFVLKNYGSLKNTSALKPSNPILQTVEITKVPHFEVTSNKVQESTSIKNAEIDFQTNNNVGYKSPQATYQEFLDAALIGEAKAQYRVAMAIDECRWDEKRTPHYLESALDKLSATGVGYSEEEIDSLRNSMEECEGIYKDNPGKNLHLVRDAWLSEAASNGSSISIAEIAFRRGDFELPGFSNGVKIEIHKALSSDLNDKFMIDKSLHLAEMYRANLYENTDPINLEAVQIGNNAIWIARCYNDWFALGLSET